MFYTYIVSNSCWELRIAQRTQEGYFSRAKELREALLAGEFPPNIREKFRSILEYFGQSPIIVPVLQLSGGRIWKCLCGYRTDEGDRKER